MTSVPFWGGTHWQLSNFANQKALVDAQSGQIWSYSDLSRDIDLIASCFGEKPKQLIALEATQHPLTVITYLAALQAGHCVWLLTPDLSDISQTELLNKFQPNWWIRPSILKQNVPASIEAVLTNAAVFTQFSSTDVALHTELACLLSTSGSTGSSQLVRLSAANLQANCDAILKVLPIRQDDKVLLNLPLHYSFGLSILNTHLAKGATIVLNEHSVLAREFWNDWQQYECTALYGVPYSYEMLNKLRLSRLPLKNVRYLAHAGGPLNQDDWQKLKEWSQSTGIPFFSMYGQTEATARIAILDPQRFLTKFSAIGAVIPDSELMVVDDSGHLVANGEVGELLFRGQSVMMGFANAIGDLCNGSAQQSLLTGDIAYQDSDGDFVIVGRKKRFIKITGHRISLDATEQWLKSQPIEGIAMSEIACAGSDDRLLCCIADDITDEQRQTMRKMLSSFLHVNVRYCRVVQVDAIPRTASGKINYAALQDVA